MPGNGTQNVRSVRRKKKEDVTPCSFVTQVINHQRQQHEKENIFNSNDVPGCNDSFGTNCRTEF